MIQLTDNLRINKNAPVDDRLGVFATTAEALSSIATDRRYVGLTVIINNGGDSSEYWFKSGITNSDLVAKSTGSTQVNSDWNATSGVAQILNKPTIPDAQVSSDWNATSGVAQILNKPTIPTYTDFIEDAINNGIVNKSPSENAVYDALAGKFNNPTGTTAQYLDGTGTPIDFPTAGQSGTLVRQVRNETGATLTKGTVVYISGASGNKALVSKAIATSDATSAQTFGIVQADITTNQNGYVVIRGDLSGLNTSAYTEGAQLYLSGTTAGTYTSTKQYAPIHLVYVGIVTRSHVNQGSIEVAIQNGYELEELHNVQAQNPSNKNSIFFDSADSQWKARAVSATDIDANVSNTEFSYLDGVTSSIQTQLNAKEGTITAGTTSQYWRGDKTFQDFPKSTRQLTGAYTAQTAGAVTTEVVLQTLTIPANTLKVNDIVKLCGLYSFASAGGTRTARIRLTNVTGTIIYAPAALATTINEFQFESSLLVTSSTTARVQSNNAPAGGYGSSTGTPANATIDISQPIVLVFTAQKSASTDTAICEYAYIQIITT